MCVFISSLLLLTWGDTGVQYVALPHLSKKVLDLIIGQVVHVPFIVQRDAPSESLYFKLAIGVYGCVSICQPCDELPTCPGYPQPLHLHRLG